MKRMQELEQVERLGAGRGLRGVAVRWMRGVRVGAALLASAGLGLSLAAAEASANDVDNEVVLTGGTNFFGALHFDSLDFTDTFTFKIDEAVSANVSLVTIGSGANNIDFTSAEINGVPLTLSPTGFLETGSLGDTLFNGPLILTVKGRSGAGGGTFASYSGTINVAIIPEPTTALLMGIGLSGLAVAARRSRPS